MGKAIQVRDVIVENMSQNRSQHTLPILGRLEDIRSECFLLQRMHIEILGRNGKFEECEGLVESQAEFLAKMDPATLTNFPVLMAMHWEYAFSIHHTKGNKNRVTFEDPLMGDSTPELTQALRELQLNPSGNYQHRFILCIKI